MVKDKEKEKEKIKKSDEGRGRKGTNYRRLNDEHDQFRVRSCNQFLSIDRVLKYILHKREEKLAKMKIGNAGRFMTRISTPRKGKKEICVEIKSKRRKNI